MKLKRFKVKNFRSIEESDWISVSDNTCLIGTNEAGKTNLLAALWKLNPANGEPIIPLDDFPRQIYSEFQSNGHKSDIFVKADFELSEDLASSVSQSLSCDLEQVKTVLVQRNYSGEFYISFPYTKIEEFPTDRVKSIIDDFFVSLNRKEFYIKEKDDIKGKVELTFKKIEEYLTHEVINRPVIENIKSDITELVENGFGRKVKLPTFFKDFLLTGIERFIDAFDGKVVHVEAEIKESILNSLPRFVYYSDYGNLDSEIYLPRVIKEDERTDLTESARAKKRTMEVLFKYVKLSPKEIYELGNDRRVIIRKTNNYNNVISEYEEDLSEEEINEWADKKRERGVLLRSAATNLTKNFKQWWQQGDYIFDFQVDGNHFRINVSDSLRPEKIELEGRSRGLQWFFSFFLVFLVETKEGHSNAILLLDEPGLSLHPIAQYDLAKFFKKLSIDNQLIYTSHSPFLVDIDNLSNVKAVYLNKTTGRSEITSNLRHNETESEKSIYPVHAALGLTVSDTLLLGCNPILVEGVSDQIYLNLIKRLLFGNGKLKTFKEFVFIPTGGVKGMGPVSKLVSSRDGTLPIVFLDSDQQGKQFKSKLLSGKYKESEQRVIEVEEILGTGAFEIEDLLPDKIIIQTIDRMYRGESYFEDMHDGKLPIIPQIENWADTNGVELIKGWKVDLAKEIFNRIDNLSAKIEDSSYLLWENLFDRFDGKKTEPKKM
ncbi:AAA family ATPase [Pontibacter sp. G13]|uniref:AAA family ATPase n=1 Tax=Pontibacter sp. G13 TaxID=3074898 RepID=UPI00288A0B00|nr:AAA family ATPase [Pontibacter sp. G13]WNJ19511.1 AAA family ATPase [Pontibacter sp. G13]